MKIVEIRNFIQILFSYSWNGKIRLDLLLLKMIENNIDFSESKKEEYVESFADKRSKNFERLVKEIQNVITSNNDCKIVSLISDADGYYLEKILDDSTGLYAKVVNKIESFESHKKLKGRWFEKFCIAFLEDFGITCRSTSISNDKGIDIYGSYKSNVNPLIGKLIKNEDIYVLGQVKYFKEKVDVPVIRKLVGDTLFIRFDELDYIEIKHNAIHLIVFSRNGFTEPAIKFAMKNKIELYDKFRIAHLISNNPDKEWSCLKIGN